MSNGNEVTQEPPLAAEGSGVTAREQRSREELAARLAREVPEVRADEASTSVPAPVTMRAPAWNVVATVRADAFNAAMRALRPFGSVARTPFYNVLTMRVEDLDRFLEALLAAKERRPTLFDAVARVIPLQRTFAFDSLADFEKSALATMLDWCDDLAGAAFHVRVHARGAPEPLRDADEEQLFGEERLGALENAGTPGRITFDDPDAIIDVEIVENAAGMSLWTRDDLETFPFLRTD